jgi:hypothetical protein
LGGASLRQIILAALDAGQAPYTLLGREIEADLEGTGHKSFKINTESGLWMATDGSGRKGNYRALRPLLGSVAPAPDAAVPLTVAADAAKVTAAAISKGRAKWKAGWLPQMNGDLPLDWADGTSKTVERGFRRTQMTDALGAVKGYLARRAFDPDHALRLGRIGRGDFGVPALLWPMHAPKVGLQCVQELVLAPDGDKKSRLFWGRASGSVMGIKPPADIASARFAGINGPIGVVGEGVETVLAAVQAAGLHGVATFSANGLVGWAEAVAANHRKHPGRSVSHIFALADRDASSTGQIAAARAVLILRDAGISASFLLPPAPEEGGPKGGDKGSDWGDYPMEGTGRDVLVNHLRLQVARADDLMEPWVEKAQEYRARQDEAVGPVQVADWGKQADGGDVPTSLASWVRMADEIVAMAETAPVEEVRRKLREIFDAIIHAAKTAKDAKERQEKISKSMLYLVQISTGGGKSTIIRELIPMIRELGLRTVIVAQDKKRAEEYASAGAFWLHGRAPARADGVVEPWTCQADWGGKIIPIVDAQHSIARTDCQNCGAGAIYQYNKSIGDGTPPSDAVLALVAKPCVGQQYRECDYLHHVAQAKEEQIVVLVPQSAGDTILSKRDLIIVDENVDLVDVVHVTADSLMEAVKKLSTISSGEGGYTAAELVAIREQMVVVQTAIVKGDRDAAITAAKALKILVKGWNTEAWEEPHFENDDLINAPLRLAKALTDGADSLLIHEQVLYVPYAKPLLEAIKHTPTILADATPSKATRDLVAGLGGKHIKLIADCKATVTVDPSRSFGALPQNVSDEEKDRDAERLAGILKAARAKNPKTCLITHKDRALRVLEKINPRYPANKIGEMFDRESLWEISTREGIGWWEWHGRAHNEWSGWDCIAIGQPALPKVAVADEWVRYAATLRSAGIACDLAAPDVTTVDVDRWLATGVYEQRVLGGAVYHDQAVLGLVLDKANNARIQAIGRSRPAQNAVEVTLFGGLPLTAAPEHGIALNYARILGPTRAERSAAQHKAAKDQYTAAAGQAIREGQEITRDNLQEICRRTIRPTPQDNDTDSGANTGDTATAPAPRRDTYSEWLGEFIAALAPVMAARGQRGGDVLRARERLQVRSDADRMAAEQAWKSLLDQWSDAEQVLDRLMDCLDDPRIATLGERVLADLLLAADEPEGHDLTR